MNILGQDQSENSYEHISEKYRKDIGEEAFKKELSEIPPGCSSELHSAVRALDGVLCIGRLATPEDIKTNEAPRQAYQSVGSAKSKHRPFCFGYLAIPDESIE